MRTFHRLFFLIILLILLIIVQPGLALPETGLPDSGTSTDSAITRESPALNETGSFSFLSDPSGAEVILDGTQQGMTPVTVEVSPMGSSSHTVVVRKTGYKDWTTTIAHNPSPGSTEEIRAVLEPVPATAVPSSKPSEQPTLAPTSEQTMVQKVEPGSFSFLSDPSGAEVILDGTSQGITPVTVEVSPTGSSSHTVVFQKTGYNDWTTTIAQNPSPGSTEEIRAVLEPVPATAVPSSEPTEQSTPVPTSEQTIVQKVEPGSFSFLSDPAGAEVILDGTSQGMTPVTVEVSPTGSSSHTIVFQKTGYKDWTTTITHNPSSGSTEEIRAVLEPVPATAVPSSEPTGQPTSEPNSEQTIVQKIESGNFSFLSDPPGAEVILDGTSQGITPVTVEVSPTGSSSHTVVFQKAGYKDWTTTIAHNPSPGSTEEIRAVLEPVPATTVPSSEPTDQPTAAPILNPMGSPVISGTENGTFFIVSVPPAANVNFDGIDLGISPISQEVSPNSTPEHSILVQKAGYKDWASVITYNPSAGVTETITADLVADVVNGSILVTSEPAGGLALLDGSATQTTPANFTDVSPGVHTVSISKDGYNPYSTSVTVSAGAQSVVFAALSPVIHSGSLTVTTNPPGSLILLNDIAYGFTPAHIDAISAGTYNLQLVKPGFQSVSETIEITAGKDTPVTASLPRRIPVTGTLVIRSSPSGGIVKVDAVERGITPMRIRGLLPDSYNVRVSIPGYLSWIGIVHIEAGRETSIYAFLTPKGPVMNTGSLSITSDPAGASVMINDNEQGRTPLILQNLLPGPYNVKMSYPGYKSATISSQIIAGKTSDLHVSLQPIPVKNLSANLKTLSDDAAEYFISHGRTNALSTFEDPYGGFLHDGMYVLSLDLNGTVLSDGGNPGLTGANLSGSYGVRNISTGRIMTTLARMGGGLLYDTSLSGDEPGQVSLIYVRPAISGVVIGTVIPLTDVALPDTGVDPLLVQETVHAAVTHAREDNGGDDVTVMDVSAPDSNHDFTLQTFDSRASGDQDRYHVTNSQILRAAATGSNGYLWLLDDSDEDTYRLILTYAEMVDDTWGIFASSSRQDDGVIMMVDVPQVSL